MDLAGPLLPEEWEWPVCDCCGSEEREEVFGGPDRLLGHPGRFSYVHCKGCGLLYQYPRPMPSALGRFYRGGYRAYHRLVREEPSPLRRWSRRYGMVKQRGYVERFLPEGRLLDVGCGTGLFLEEMQRSGRWDLQGIEPSADAASYVQKKLGLPVQNSTFEETTLPPSSQDVITMWYVLEHLPSPTTALRKAHVLLRPGGMLILALPNYESLDRRLFGRYWSGWDLPRHLYLFPRPLFQKMLQECGFEVVDCRCFQITYSLLGQSLEFWVQDWPAGLSRLGRLLCRLYYSLPFRVALYPVQLLFERLKLAPVLTWAARRCE